VDLGKYVLMPKWGDSMRGWAVSGRHKAVVVLPTYPCLSLSHPDKSFGPHRLCPLAHYHRRSQIVIALYLLQTITRTYGIFEV
jgi:hypothetical protein